MSFKKYLKEQFRSSSIDPKFREDIERQISDIIEDSVDTDYHQKVGGGRSEFAFVTGKDEATKRITDLFIRVLKNIGVKGA